MISTVLSYSRASGQEVYRGCRTEGDAKSVFVQDLNLLKNRYHATAREDFDRSATVLAMLAPSSDSKTLKPLKSSAMYMMSRSARKIFVHSS